jgi:sensor domain CHASE-containing protein
MITFTDKEAAQNKKELIKRPLNSMQTSQRGSVKHYACWQVEKLLLN